MQLISFEHVGIKEFETYQVYETPQSQQPIGIKTPVALARNGETLFEMNYDFASQVDDNMRNLILTNFGERLGRYNFGANLRELVTEYVSRDDFDSEAMSRIKTAVTRWLPYVELEGFGSTPIYENNVYTGQISITVQYSVPRLNVLGRILEVLLYTV